MFSPLLHRVRAHFYFALVLLLSGCLTETAENSNSAFHALAQGTVAEYSATQTGHRWIFPRLDSQLFTHDPALHLFLKMEVRSSKPFPLRRVGVGINGVRSHFPLRLDLARHAEWAKINGTWNILVNLSRAHVYPRKSALEVVNQIQEFDGKVQLWVRSPSEVLSAELIFVDPAKAPLPTDLGIPTVTIDTVQPAGEEITFKNISFYFSASEQAKRFYCSLDNQSFKACASPQTYKRLNEGRHTFRVKAKSMRNEMGPVTSYSFKRVNATSDVEITELVPSESPTSSTTLKITFEANNQKTLSPWKLSLWNYWKSRCEGRRLNLFCRLIKSYVEAPNFLPQDRAYCQIDGSGFALCESPVTYSNLAEGAHTVEIRPLNQAGNPTHYSWSVDRTAPRIAWTNVPEVLTPTTTTRFEFESDESASFECSLNGEGFDDCTSPWEFEVEPGTHQVTVRAKDLAGNDSEALSYSWSVENERPQLEILGLNPQETQTAATSLSVTFGSDTAVNFYCFLDLPTLPEDWEPFACASPLELENLAEGQHSLVLYARTITGATSDAVTHTWTVDTTAPNLSLSLTHPSVVPTTSGEARFVFDSSEAVSFGCALDGDDFSTCHSPLVLSGLAEGEHTLDVEARDLAGNVSDTASFSWEVDQTAPTLAFTESNPPELLTQERSRVVYFDVSEAGTEVSCELNGGGVFACASPFVVNDLADGTHRLVVSVTDKVGLQGQAVHEWEVYSSAEVYIENTLPAERITPENSMSITFYSSNTQSFICRLDGGAFESCTSPVVYNALADGPHQFEVAGVDRNGDPGDSVTHSWSVYSGPLQITDVSVSEITRTTALVTWKTNLPATSQVAFGVGDVSAQSEIDATYVTQHTALLTDLTPFALYSFQTMSSDTLGRPAQSPIQTFRTLR